LPLDAYNCSERREITLRRVFSPHLRTTLLSLAHAFRPSRSCSKSTKAQSECGRDDYEDELSAYGCMQERDEILDRCSNIIQASSFSATQKAKWEFDICHLWTLPICGVILSLVPNLESQTLSESFGPWRWTKRRRSQSFSTILWLHSKRR
jgi:hypothetical protein